MLIWFTMPPELGNTAPSPTIVFAYRPRNAGSPTFVNEFGGGGGGAGVEIKVSEATTDAGSAADIVGANRKGVAAEEPSVDEKIA